MNEEFLLWKPSSAKTGAYPRTMYIPSSSIQDILNQSLSTQNVNPFRITAHLSQTQTLLHKTSDNVFPQNSLSARIQIRFHKLPNSTKYSISLFIFSISTDKNKQQFTSRTPLTIPPFDEYFIWPTRMRTGTISVQKQPVDGNARRKFEIQKHNKKKSTQKTTICGAKNQLETLHIV